MAIIVSVAHSTGLYSAVASWCVWVFYLLSGYLMTLLCDGTYQGRWSEFWISRLLRIFPTYWVVMAATTLGLWFWGYPQRFPLLALPIPHEWLLLNIQTWWGGFEGPRTIPPAWSLTVELFWWLLISVGALNRRWVLWWMAGGAALAVAGAYPLGPLWFSLWGGMLPFALGSWLYQNGLVIPRDGRWSSVAGAMSYPIYVSHYGIGAVASVILSIPLGWPLFFAALAPTLALSWLLLVAVERPIARYRARFRHQR